MTEGLKTISVIDSLYVKPREEQCIDREERFALSKRILGSSAAAIRRLWLVDNKLPENYRFFGIGSKDYAEVEKRKDDNVEEVYSFRPRWGGRRRGRLFVLATALSSGGG